MLLIIYCTIPSSTCLQCSQTMCYTIGPSSIRLLQSYTLHPPKLNLSIVEPDHVLDTGAKLRSCATNYILHHSQLNLPTVQPDHVLHQKLYTAQSPAQLAYCGTRQCTTSWRGAQLHLRATKLYTAPSPAILDN